MPEPTAGGEKRVTVRLASTQQASCHFATWDAIEHRWATVKDVSATGIALVTSFALAPGTLVLIELPTKDASLQEAVSARVMRCLDLQGSYLLGCGFAHPLTSAQLQHLV